MFWRHLASAAVIGLGSVMGMAPANAALVAFNFTTLNSGNEGLLASSVSTPAGVGAVTADGFNWGLTAGAPSSSPVSTAPLWLRNGTNDHGLGVCSEGSTTCAQNVGGGDVNELSNGTNAEALRLTKQAGRFWSSLWVSSLDDGGTNGAEKGVLYWSNSATSFTGANSVKFSFGPSCNVECDLFSLLGSAVTNLFAGSTYLLFMNDSTNGTDNDYLVWKGSTVSSSDIPPGNDVPEPASLALLGVGLLGLGMVTRHRA